LKGILYLLDYFQTNIDVRLIYYKGGHVNIINNFNIILVYKHFKNVKKRLIMPEVAPINMVWP
jgi:hypothetical protein